MAAITYYALANYTLNQIKRICVNIDDNDNLFGDETNPQRSSHKTFNLSNVISTATGGTKATCYLYSIGNDGQAVWGAPPVIASSNLRNLMKSEFSKLGIDIDSTATRTPKEAVHFINAVILFLSYHLYIICDVEGEKLPDYAFNDGNKRAIAFNSGNTIPMAGIGLPSITSANKIEDRDLLIETFNSLCSILPSAATRLGGLDIAGITVTCCSSSSSSSSSSCSSSSCSSSSSSSLFIAYFNI